LGTLAAGSTALQSIADWGEKMIVETFTPATKRYEGRKIGDIAAEERKTPFDALLDIVVADDLRTSFVHAFPPETDTDWAVREQLVRDPRTVIGGADTGAHLDMITSFSFATDMLARMVRERGLLTTEEAVHLLTAGPADLYGLVGRGRLEVGAMADVVVFDEETIRPGPVTTRFDLPGGAGRLYADAIGVEHVVVNGRPIVTAGELTGSCPGAVLRSGIDTVTPSMA
jgi:N-acyl-D-aspartate/D-glutamate deacylase